MHITWKNKSAILIQQWELIKIRRLWCERSFCPLLLWPLLLSWCSRLFEAACTNLLLLIHCYQVRSMTIEDCNYFSCVDLLVLWCVCGNTATSIARIKMERLSCNNTSFERQFSRLFDFFVIWRFKLSFQYSWISRITNTSWERRWHKKLRETNISLIPNK